MAQGVGSRVRHVVTVVVLSLAVVLAPVATVGAWLRVQLVDTEQFVETYAPLAEDSDVKAFVADQIGETIMSSIDIDKVLDDLVTGLGPLGLSPRATAALRLLTEPAAQGVRSLVDDAARAVVDSPQFATAWEQALRQTHARTTALLRGDPDATLNLSEEGMVSLELGPLVAQVKQRLQDRGFALASLIPEVDRSIPIVQVDSLVQVRAAYQFAVVAGSWLPWLVVVLLAGGLVLARHRLRALFWTSGGLLLGFVLLAIGLAVGRRLVIDRLSPTPVPEAVAAVVWSRTTMALSATTTTLIVVAAVVAVVAWVFGDSRGAGAIRRGLGRGVQSVRAALSREA